MYKRQVGSDTLIVTDDEMASLTLTIVADSISENGGATTATVSRNSGTTGDLVVTLLSDDTSEATVVGMVTIPDGASVSPAFNITGQDDVIADGDQSVTVTGSATGHTVGSDTLIVTDDEMAALTLTIVADSISENGGATTATVSRNSGTSGDLVVTLLSDDTSEATVVGMVTIPDGASVSPAFNITGQDDVIADGDQTVTITGSATGHAVGNDVLVVTDDDTVTPTLVVSIADDAISENGGFTSGIVSRNTDTTNDLTVNLLSDDTSEATVLGTVTINAGQSSATFQVNAVDDQVVDGIQTATITASATGHASGADSVDVTDDETAVVSIQQVQHGTEAGNGGPTSAEFEVSVSTAAEFDLTIPVVNSGSAIAGVDYVDFTTVTIPAGQTSTTVSVTVIDDNIAERPDVLNVELVDPAIPGVSIDTTNNAATTFLLDNDIAGISVSRNSVTVSEPGTAETIGVTLSSQPTAPVTVEVFVADPSEVSVDVTQLTFTPADWNVPQTITLTAEDDPIADGSQDSAVVLFIDPVGAPGLFEFAAATEVSVSTLDDEPVVGPVTLDSVTFYNKDADLERDLSPQQNGQRSLVRHIEVVFDGLVTVPMGPVANGSFVVQNTDDGSIVGLNVDSATQVGSTTTVVLSFTTNTEAVGSLTDGNYELTIDGAPLGIDGDGSGTVGGLQQTGFHRLFGDSDGDRDVDGRDFFNLLKARFSRPATPNVFADVFDYDDDGNVFGDLDDLFALAARYGDVLAGPRG